MVERTAVLRRVVEVVRDRGPVAVVGHPCPWRDDLVEVLAARLDHPVTAYDAVPDDAGAVVWLELAAGEAAVRRAASRRPTRGEPIVPGGRWVAYRPLGDAAVEEPLVAPAGVDVAFVPASGVRAPRRLRVSWGDPAQGLWADSGDVDRLEELLGLPDDVRRDLSAAVDAPGPEPADLRERIRAAVGPDFDVTG